MKPIKLEKGSMTMLWAEPGAGLEPFMFHMIRDCLRTNKKVIVVVSNKKIEFLKKEAESLGYDLNNPNIKFIDSYSRMITFQVNGKKVVKNPLSIKSIMSKVRETASGVRKDVFIFFNDFSTIINACGPRIINEFKKQASRMNKKGLTIIPLFTEWPYDGEVTAALRSIADSVIKVSNDYFRKNDLLIPYKVLRPGGLRFLNPRILMIGGHEFISKSSVKPLKHDRIGSGVLLSHGVLDYQGLTIDLFNYEKENNLGPVIELLGHGVLGAVTFNSLAGLEDDLSIPVINVKPRIKKNEFNKVVSDLFNHSS